MAGVFHISEAEAARDFAAVMRRVRAGEEVVVEDAAGAALAVMRSAGKEVASGDVSRGARGRTVAETIERLRSWEHAHGSLRMGAEFADDLEQIHREYNRPMEDHWG